MRSSIFQSGQYGRRIRRDPYASNVTLLLHCDGANNSTTFTDDSPFHHAVTANGNAKIVTSGSDLGGAAGFFDGTGDYLSIPANSSAFNIRPGDFTLETGLRIAANSPSDANSQRCAFLLSAGHPDGNVTDIDEWFLRVDGNSSTTGTGLTFIAVDNSTVKTCSAAFAFTQGTRYRIACVRSSTGIKFYVDGTGLTNGTDTVGTSTYSGGLRSASTYIGMNNSATGNSFNRQLNGYIDEMRITKGVARYLANYTPDASPFPNA
jgi:hypothetical protein